MEDFLTNVRWITKKSRSKKVKRGKRTIQLVCEGECTEEFVNILQQCSTWMETSIRMLRRKKGQEYPPLVIEDVSKYMISEVLKFINTGNIDIYAQRYLKDFATALKNLGIHQPGVSIEETFVVLRTPIFVVPNTYANDVKLYCEGEGDEVFANRCVLMLRSGYFDEILQEVLEGSGTQVPGVSFRQLQQVVRFLYCRDLELRTWTENEESEFEQFCSLIDSFQMRHKELPQHEALLQPRASTPYPPIGFADVPARIKGNDPKGTSESSETSGTNDLDKRKRGSKIKKNFKKFIARFWRSSEVKETGNYEVSLKRRYEKYGRESDEDISKESTNISTVPRPSRLERPVVDMHEIVDVTVHPEPQTPERNIYEESTEESASAFRQESLSSEAATSDYSKPSTSTATVGSSGTIPSAESSTSAAPIPQHLRKKLVSQTTSQDTSSSGTRTRVSSESSKITAQSSLESSNITYEPRGSVVSPDIYSLDVISSIEEAEGDESKGEVFEKSAKGIVSKVVKFRAKKFFAALPKIRFSSFKRKKKSRHDRKRSSSSSLTQELPPVFHEPLGSSTTQEGGSSEDQTKPTRSRRKRRFRQWYAVVADRFNRLTIRRREDRPRSPIDPSSGDPSTISRRSQSQDADLQTPKKSSKRGSSFRKQRKASPKKGKSPSDKNRLFELTGFFRGKSRQSSEGGFSSDISSSAPEQAGPSRKSDMPSTKKAGRSPKGTGGSSKGPGRSPKGPGRSPKGPGRSPKGTARSLEEAGPSGTQAGPSGTQAGPSGTLAGYFRRLQSFFKKPTPPPFPEYDETGTVVSARQLQYYLHQKKKESKKDSSSS